MAPADCGEDLPGVNVAVCGVLVREANPMSHVRMQFHLLLHIHLLTNQDNHQESV